MHDNGVLCIVAGIIDLLHKSRLLGVVHLHHVLVHHHVGAEPQHQSHDEANAHLSHNLILAFQAFLVLAVDLDVVVAKSQESQPHGGDDHENDVDVAHASQQQHRQEDGGDNHKAAHRWCSHLFLSKWVDAGIALSLANLALAHVVDELLTQPCREHEREDEREQRTERDVLPHVRPRDVVLF